MNRLLRWFYALSFIGFLVWISLTSPKIYECVSTQYKNYHGDTFQENIASLYELLRGSRFCIGDFIDGNGEAVIALFTIILAIATILLWVVTQGILTDSRLTTQQQLRAYVFIRDSMLEGFSSPSGPSFNITFTNSGKTPAWNLKIAMDAFILEHPSSQERHAGEFSDHGALGPNGIYTMSATMPALTQEEIADVRAANKAIYVFGRVEFEDAFGNEQWLVFRIFFNRKTERGSFFSAPTGNDASR